MAARTSSGAIDHSLTYRVRALRNLPHRMRLRDIERLVRRLDLDPGLVYADFGCSNGFLTAKVREWISAGRTYGFDRIAEHLKTGQQLYPEITFAPLDLNEPGSRVPRCGFVTCFETLEHVGDLEAAVAGLARSLDPNGRGLITVPIEIGWPGVVKFLIKVGLYGYRLSELPPRPGLGRAYLLALLSGRRLSRFRDRRSGWSTHFGFDYRDVDDALARHKVTFRAINRGFTRFYLLTR
jgi:SAM-dependent methyltransferase